MRMHIIFLIVQQVLSRLIQARFTVKCRSNTTAQTETGAKTFTHGGICLHNHSHHVCFEALLVAKALQNRFSIDTKELLPKAVCTRAKRGKQNLHKVFFAMVHVLHRLLETTRDSSAI